MLSFSLPAYEVESLLGWGGMGAVYRATQRSLKRSVAIKLLRLSAADDDLKFAERFRHEAETLARLNHPGIVDIHDFGETSDGLLYLVMEFVDGTDVQHLIRGSGRLSEDSALSITAHVCDALAYAHSRGVVHRDIKPANVLIDNEGNVKVADFGLAKMADPTFEIGLTLSNVAIGTPDYVAPEALSSEMVVDHRADLYAVGVMLYQMLTGDVPRGLFKLPSQRGIVADERWDEIICRAMEPDREERYQSALEVRSALDEIHPGSGVTSAPRLLAEEVPQKSVEIRRRRTLATGSSVLIAIGAGFVILHLASQRHQSEKPDSVVFPISPQVRMMETEGGPIEAAQFNDPYSWTDVLGGKNWNPPWQFEGGALRTSEKNSTSHLGVRRDGAVRVKLRYLPDTETSSHVPLFSVTVRGGREFGGSYQFQIIPQKHLCNLLFLPEDPVTGAPGTPQFLWEEHPLIWKGTDLELEFVACDNRLSLSSGGKEVASVEDTRSSSGSWGATLSPGFEIRELSLGLPRSAETSLQGVEWSDVTERIREKAAANPDLVTETGGIRRSGTGSPVSIAVTDPAWRNYAVRIRHSADTQINLRAGDHGMVYVLCQGTKTLIHRYDDRESEPVVLEPGIPHPPGFDVDKPHELLASIEDNLIRAWVDGRFAGQVRDSAFATGPGTVTWVAQSVVHSVEVAHLPDPTLPKLGLSFWGQVSKVNAARVVEIVEKAVEEINQVDVSLESTVEDGKVIAIKIFSNDGKSVHDLSPVAALSDLKALFCYAPGVRDLDWLRGMPVTHLQLEHAEVEDLGILRETRISDLDLDFPNTPPVSYGPLAGMPLRSLSLQQCQLADFSFAVGMPLNRIVLNGTEISDYAHLAALPLEEIEADLASESGLTVLLAIPTLKKINGKAVEE